MNANYWLDTATGKIRFTPDRKAVRRELQDHLEDRMEAGRAKGLSAYEAECAATAAMGDPDALAEALAKVHAPWWGYFQRLTTVALVGVAIAALFALWGILRDDARPERYVPTLPEEVEIRTYADSTRTFRRLQVWRPEGSVDLGQYQVTVPMAYLVRRGPWTSDHDGTTSPTSWELTVVLAVRTGKFWETVYGGQDMVLSHTATDSEGRSYNYDYGDATLDTDRELFCYAFDGGPFTTYFEVYFDLPSAQAPQWVEIPFGYGGDAVRVDLTGEGAVR